MWKKVFLISAAAGAAILGAVGLAKNSKKIKMHRLMKKAGTAMYNVGTMLRVLSMQTAS